MFKPEIFAKGSLTHEQLSVKERIGCDGLEVQLLSELIRDRELGMYNKADSVFDLKDLSCHNIRVVHAPLVPGMGDVTLEIMVDSKDAMLLKQIFYIADYYGKMNNRNTLIVLHSESYYESMSDMGDLWNRVVHYIDVMLNEYTNVEVCIENVSPLRGIGKGKRLHLANNFITDNVVMAQNLCRELGTDKIGTCLDTCHAMLTEKYIGGLYDMVDDVSKPDLSMEGFFKENASCIKLIHLADIAGSGYGKGRHGVSFTETSYIKLCNILSLYEGYKYRCPITLEVEETDYSVCDGYATTKLLVDRYYNTFG